MMAVGRLEVRLVVEGSTSASVGVEAEEGEQRCFPSAVVRGRKLSDQIV